MREILVGVGVFLVCLVGATEGASGQTTDDLAWVPADGPGFVSLRLAHLWQHESTKELRTLLAKSKVDVNKELEGAFGLTLQEVERLILLVPPPGGQPVFVVTTVKPGLDRLLKRSTPASKKKHKEHTYYEAEGGAQAIHAAGERLFVIGPTKDVLKLLDRAGQKKADGPLNEALKLAAGKAPLAACVNLAALGKDFKGSLPPQAEAALPLFEADPALITVLADADTRITARLTCASAEDAKKKAQTLRTTLDILRQFIPVGRTELAKDEGKDELTRWLLKQADTFLADLEEAIKAAQLEAKARVVHGQLRLRTNAGTLLTLAAGVTTVQRSEPPPGQAR